MGTGIMATMDWRSEEAYANFKNAESMDVAWEWLRRDANYQSDFRNLEDAQRLSGATETFRQQWGLSFRS
jgi:hypothetical protein